jgi:flagellar motor switch protein FliN
MSETIEYQQFEQNGGAGASDADGRAGANDANASSASSSPQADLSRLSDIPMELSVEIGRTHMTVGETLDLRVGSVVALERLAGETADLLVNGSPIARGEVVVIDEQYGLRITEVLDTRNGERSSLQGGAVGFGEALPGAPAAHDAQAGIDGAPAFVADAAHVDDAPQAVGDAPGEAHADVEPTDEAVSVSGENADDDDASDLRD